jgi:hypothetical protein
MGNAVCHQSCSPNSFKENICYLRFFVHFDSLSPSLALNVASARAAAISVQENWLQALRTSLFLETCDLHDLILSCAQFQS